MAPFTSSAAAAVAAPPGGEAEGGEGEGGARRPAGQADDFKQLRNVLAKYMRQSQSGERSGHRQGRGSGERWSRGRRQRLDQGAAAAEEQPAYETLPGMGRGGGAGGSGVAAAPGSTAAAAPAPASRLLRMRHRPLVVATDDRMHLTPLALSPAARAARQEESVRVNKSICRKFDKLDRQLSSG